MYDVDWKDPYYSRMYVCVHVSMSRSNRVIRNHSCGGMIAYIGKWHEEVPSLSGIKWEEYSWQKYEVSIMWIWIYIVCLYYTYPYVMVRLYQAIHQQSARSVFCSMLGQEWIRHWTQGCLVKSQCGFGCVVKLLCICRICCTFCTCDVVCMWCGIYLVCVHVDYVMLCTWCSTDSVVWMFHI